MSSGDRWPPPGSTTTSPGDSTAPSNTGSPLRRHRSACDDRDSTRPAGRHHRIRHRRHLRLDAEVVSTEFDGKTWQVTTTDGTTHEADFVVAATGLLHHPGIPDIPGLESFAGDVVHTARWDDGLETAGRRIAVIGTGSTGVQVVSALQPEAERISHFVRSPQWVMWAPLRLPQPAIVGAILRRMPRLDTALYRLLLRSSDLAVDIMTRPSWRRRLAQEYARMSLRVQVRDPRLRASLTPDDEPFCKRQVVSDTYYRAIAAPNADLVPDGIERIEPHEPDDQNYQLTGTPTTGSGRGSLSVSASG
ncbi:flavin-containing monooxygenase [Nocardia asteroides]|uniref:flavin-containing monooxygenase n=1 Tax=Nocardia asteroides TaxID=1824 RepID=UPI003657C5F2